MRPQYSTDVTDKPTLNSSLSKSKWPMIVRIVPTDAWKKYCNAFVSAMLYYFSQNLDFEIPWFWTTPKPLFFGLMDFSGIDIVWP